MKSRPVGPAGLVLLLISVVVTPFLSTHYRTFQFSFVAIYLIALLGLNILTGFTGQISLGHGAFMGIGAYTTTLLVVDHGWRDLWTLPVAGIVAGIAGIAFGLPATRFAGPYLALATFAIPLSFIGLLKRFPHFTGGNLGKGLPPLHSELGLNINPSVWLYLVSWIVALAMLALAYLIVHGRLGRSFRAVRDSEIAATANGVSTAAIKTLAFGISAFFCGIAGGLFAMGVSYVNPDTFPIDLSILLLVGVVLGGAGSHRRHGLRRALRRVHPHHLGPGNPRPRFERPPHQHTRARLPTRRLRGGAPPRPLRGSCRRGRPRRPSPGRHVSCCGLVEAATTTLHRRVDRPLTTPSLWRLTLV